MNANQAGQRIRLNPRYNDAPYEYATLMTDGSLAKYAWPMRFASLEDAKARKNPVPFFIVEENGESRESF